MKSIAEARCLIVDMDGVLWHGLKPLPGLTEFFAVVRLKGLRVILATNNASLTPDQYVTKLEGMGVTVAREEVLTSAAATGMFLANTAARGARVYAIGEDGVLEALRENGLSLTEDGADYVVVGMDRGLNWDKLARATMAIHGGAKFVGTNPDTSLPTERGIVHGNGAILAALTAATGVSPLVVGKPEPLMYRLAMQKLGAEPAETAAIGDRLDTDILGAVRAGIASALVFTGVSKPEDVEQSDYMPTWTFPGLPELTRAIQA